MHSNPKAWLNLVKQGRSAANVALLLTMLLFGDGFARAETVIYSTGFEVSEGFDPDSHLQAIGVANQTTMLRGETEEVQRRLKAAMTQKYGEAELPKHFRFFDTICGATQDRQDALEKLLRNPLDLLLVIGGYNSSNTSHLAEMGESKLPTYFIKNAAKMMSDGLISHYDQHRHCEVETHDWLPTGKVTVGITAGASCPNNLIEDAIRRLFELRGISVQQVLQANGRL